MDHEQAAVRRGGRGLAGGAVDDHLARHHVLGDPDTGVAVHPNPRLLVHPRAVVADVPGDLDVARRVEPDRDAVASAGMRDPDPARVATVVQRPIELTHAVAAQIKRQCHAVERVGVINRHSVTIPQL